MRLAGRRKLWLLGLAVSTMALAACGSSGTKSSTGGGRAGAGSGANKGKTIKLGAVFSLTGPGGVYGPQQKNAVELAQQVINGKGGVNGANITFDIRDDGSDKAQSPQQTQTLIQQGQVVAMLGPTLSNSAVAAHPIADNLRTPMLAVSTTGLNIVGNCPYPFDYIFHGS